MKLIFKTILSVVLFCLIITDVSSQDAFKKNIDSMLAGVSEDLTKAKILIQLARSASFMEREKSIQFYKEALQYEADKYNRALIIDTIGLFSWQSGNYIDATEYFEKALILFEELNDSLWIGKVNNNIAVVQYGLGNSNVALDYYQTALTIRKSLNDTIGISKISNNIGLIYQDWGMYEDAFKWHNDALDLALEVDDYGAIAYSYSNVGLCYENLNDLDKALDFYIQGYKTLLETDENNRSNSFFSANIGGVYLKMNKPDSALFHYQKSLDYAKRINNKNRIAIAEYNIGRTFLILNDIFAASKHISNSYDLSNQYNYITLKKDNLFILSEIEEKKGNTNLAYQYFKSASDLKDSIFNKEKVAKFTDLQIKYNMDQQEKENLILKQKNEIQDIKLKEQKQLSTILIIGGVLILIVLFFIAKSRISYKKLSMRLEKSEKELISANAAKDKFFTIIAHDLKGPFNAILGYSELLKSNYDNFNENDKQQIISDIGQSADRSYKLLENLLFWAQNETGRIQYSPTKINISEISNNTVSINKLSASSKNIKLKSDIKSPVIAFADLEMVNTVLRNLVSNAIKFTKDNGSVSINAKKVNKDNLDMIQISVSDTGMGISDENISRIFTLGENISTRGTHDEKGTGLGLILCSELVKKNKGSIWVESVKGKGSTFYFTLPEFSEMN